MSPVLVNPSRFVTVTPTTTYSSEVLADTPLFYLKFDETTGTTAADSSGNSHSGTHTNGVTVNQSSLLTDGSGKSALYDGVDDYTRVDFGSWMAVSTCTLECIIKPTSSALSGVRIIGGRWEGQFTRAQLLYLNGGKLAGAAWIGAQRDVAGGTTLSADTTHTVALRYDGTNLQLFLDGVLDGSTAFTGTLDAASNAAFEIGRASLSNTNTYLSLIDEVSFYGTALSTTRLAAHAAAR